MSQNNLDDLFDAVVDESTFLRFANAMLQDREVFEGQAQSIDGFQGPWANSTIASFLEAAIAWAENSEFGVRPGPKPENPWQLFATFLWAGRSYE